MVASFRPRFNTVSIMPGMENFEPERTETNNGFSGSPNLEPIAFSTLRRLAIAPSHNPFGYCLLFLKYSIHASVVIVKPGGTFTPRFVISARPDPLPPRRSFISPLPSALPLPKK